MDSASGRVERPVICEPGPFSIQAAGVFCVGVIHLRQMSGSTASKRMSEVQIRVAQEHTSNN